MQQFSYGSVARWTARTLSLLYFAVIAFFIIAHAVSPEGLPIVWKQSLDVQLDFLALFLLVVGGLVGWKWEGVAAVMILVGTSLWLFVEQQLPWPPGLSLLIGALYLCTWWSLEQPHAKRMQAAR